MANASQTQILSNVLDKLDTLGIDFNVSDLDVLPAYQDTLREMNLADLSSIQAGSTQELYIEIRTEYWMLHRFKNDQTLNFKYSTSIDGRSIDKTMIPTLIQQTMDDLDEKFSSWFNRNYRQKSSGLWAITQRTATRLK